MTNHMEWKFHSLGGKLNSCRPVCISRNNNRETDVLIASGYNISCVSSKTGEWRCSFIAHTATVTCLATVTSQNGSTQLISCSKDGEIIMWNCPCEPDGEATIVKRTTLQAPVHDIIGLSPDELYMVQEINSSSDKAPKVADKSFKLVFFDWKSNKVTRKVCEIKQPSQCIASISVVIGQQNHKWILAGFKSKVYVWSTASQSLVSVRTCPSTSSGSIQCLASAGSDWFVTGHLHGEIFIWRDPANLVRPNSLPVCTRLHWHAHAVTSLAVSGDKLQLYSGGKEGVLVLWRVSTGEHTYLPRLGEEVLSIVDGDTEVLVTTRDNCIRIVNPASLKVRWQLRQLYVPPADPRLAKAYRQADTKFGLALEVEPRTGMLVTNGYPGELQMTDVAGTIRHGGLTSGYGNIGGPGAVYKHSVQVTGYTRVSAQEEGMRATMYLPCVSLFKFFKTNTRETVLCTVDVRRAQGLEAEASLKMWLWSAANHAYKLLTQVDRPHGAHRVTGLELGGSVNGGDSGSGSVCVCVTGATDGSVRVWNGTLMYPKSASTSNSTSAGLNSSIDFQIAIGMAWHCAYSFTYRLAVCHCVHISADSTLLCVAHGSVVTVWSPTELTLRATFVSSLPQHSVMSIHTIAHPDPHPLNKNMRSMFLMLTTRRSVCVYDMLTLKHLWTLQASEEEAVEVSSGTESSITYAWIAVCVREDESENHVGKAEISRCKVLLLTPASGVPLLARESQQPLVCGTFLCPRVHGKVGVVWLTASGELQLFRVSDTLQQQLLLSESPLVEEATRGTSSAASPVVSTPVSYAQVARSRGPALVTPTGISQPSPDISGVLHPKPEMVEVSQSSHSRVTLDSTTTYTYHKPTLEALFASTFSFKPVVDASESQQGATISQTIDVARETSYSAMHASAKPEPPETASRTQAALHADLSMVQNYFARKIQSSVTRDQNTADSLHTTTTYKPGHAHNFETESATSKVKGKSKMTVPKALLQVPEVSLLKEIEVPVAAVTSITASVQVEQTPVRTRGGPKTTSVPPIAPKEEVQHQLEGVRVKRGAAAVAGSSTAAIVQTENQEAQVSESVSKRTRRKDL